MKKEIIDLTNNSYKIDTISYSFNNLSNFKNNIEIKNENIENTAKKLSNSYKIINLEFLKNKNSNIEHCSQKIYNTKLYINKHFYNIKKINNGHFSKIFLWNNKVDKNKYIVKKFKINKFHNEIKIIGFITKLKSKYIIRYYKSWIEKDFGYLIFEKCKFSLFKLLSNNKFFSELFLLKIIKDISCALMIWHKNKFIHFDIKPENIVLSENNNFKLIDFGLTKNYNKDFNNNHFREGDSRYLDPLVLHWEYEFKDLVKTDIYSLGITIFQLMTLNKNLPLNGKYWRQIRSKEIIHDIKNLKYSMELKKIILDMLNQNPLERISSSSLNLRVRNLIQQHFN